ncbi:hypothetical protein [Peribacillus frigoritolerans]|uniref:hypothetical protein n=1 Tax=Peribacillus frigoritolerans TaxID=450367 RepID=UPI003F7EEDD4
MNGCRNGNGLFLYGLSHRCMTGKIGFLMNGTQFNVTFSNEEQAVYVFESKSAWKSER